MAEMQNGYGISDEEEMSKVGLCDYDPTGWRGYPRGVVVRYEMGKPVEIVGEDGGEPEDQTLDRDWSWVVPALNAAQERGRSELIEALRDAIDTAESQQAMPDSSLREKYAGLLGES